MVEVLVAAGRPHILPSFLPLCGLILGRFGGSEAKPSTQVREYDERNLMGFPRQNLLEMGRDIYPKCP